jgi:hypothetical protein
VGGGGGGDIEKLKGADDAENRPGYFSNITFTDTLIGDEKGSMSRSFSKTKINLLPFISKAEFMFLAISNRIYRIFEKLVFVALN